MTEIASTAGRITVLLCDDHALLRSGLKRLLEAEDDLRIVAEAANAEQAIERAREVQPDVILLDIVMPGRSGLDVLPELLEVAPNAKVVILSMQDEPGYVRRAFASGASGYVVKAAADSELLQAVREVAGGRRYVHPRLGASLAAGDAGHPAPNAPDPLSEREREVLGLLALGHTNQEIANRLSISVRTVETHRAHIMRKLNFSTRAEMVRYALATGRLDAQAVTA